MINIGPRRRRLLVAVPVALCLSGWAPPPAWAGIDGEIVYARSTDGGASFSHANLSNDPELSLLAQVAAADGSTHVVWKQNDTGDVLYRRSTDDGARFASAVELSRSPGDSSEPNVAAGGGHVNVVWAEQYIGSGNEPDPEVKGDEIYGRRSSNAGERFSSRVNVSASRDEHTRDPAIAADDGLVVLVYEDRLGQDKATGNDEIFLRRSSDGGRKWSNPVNLSRDAANEVESAVAISGQDVHVAWEHRGDTEDITDDRIRYTRSSDGGAKFADPVVLPSDVPTRKPSVAASAAEVHVVSCIRSDKTGLFDSDVLYHRSDDGGVTWGQPVRVSETDGNCGAPVIASRGSDVYIAWTDTTPRRNDIFVRHSGDGGRNFTAVQNVSGSRGSSEDVSIAVDASTGTVHLVWTDFSVETPSTAQPAMAGGIPGATLGRRYGPRSPRSPRSP